MLGIVLRSACFIHSIRVTLLLPHYPSRARVTRPNLMPQPSLTRRRLLARLGVASRLIPASTPVTRISRLSFSARWWLQVLTAPTDELVSPTYVHVLHALLLEAWFPSCLTPAGNLFYFLCLTAAYITQQIISYFHAQLILQHLLPTWSVCNLTQNQCPSFFFIHPLQLHFVHN
jgi:hypothetical protein